LKHPWLRFLLLGTLLFAADVAWLRPAPGPALPPGPLSDDELLFHEALGRGYHETDGVVRRRLAMNMRFALGEEDSRGEAELVEEALSLGMHLSDVVVRRRLVQKMSLRLQAGGRSQEPSDPELQAHLDANAERWTEPARVRIVQLFFRELADAEGAVRTLAAEPEPLRTDPEALRGLGDAIPLPTFVPPSSESELARQFGPNFASRVMALDDGAWRGPIASAYGHHAVFVGERSAARRSPLDVVRTEVRESLLAERSHAALRREVLALRQRYGVPAPEQSSQGGRPAPEQSSQGGGPAPKESS
jgi:hypothetical protein